MSTNTIKTVVTDVDVTSFIQGVDGAGKREDGMKLLEIFSRVTDEEPKMWGPSIIGFGTYHYKSERSRQEGDWMLTGFSPRKANLTVYIMPGFENYTDLLAKLGKHKISSGSCLYINKLSDVNIEVLEELVAKSFQDMKRLHNK